MNSEPNQSSQPEQQAPDPADRLADPLDLVEQQLEHQPTIDPEELTSNPAISPQMLNEGDNLRGDLTKDE